MSTASVNGITASRMRVNVPAWGAPWVDVDLTEETALAAGNAVTVVLADLTISGVVVSGGSNGGRSAYHIVGGKGGWNRELPAGRPYADDLGIKVSTVLGDAARAAGETLADVPDTRLGPRFARIVGPASRVLHELAPRNWYVDFAGVTHIGQRPTTTYTGDDPRTRVDKALGVIDLAVESLAGLVPGVIVDGSRPATDVQYELEGSRLTARIYAAAYGDRFLNAQRRIFEALFPDIRYRGTFEFRVVTQTGERLNLQPVRVSSGFGDLAAVPVRPGMAGLKAMVQLGELVLVTFADADPSRPQVIAHDAPDAPGWMPLQLELGGPGALGIARIGDTVQAGPYAGVITSGSARVKAAL
jgi:hypothetical protein